LKSIVKYEAKKVSKSSAATRRLQALSLPEKFSCLIVLWF